MQEIEPHPLRHEVLVRSARYVCYFYSIVLFIRLIGRSTALLTGAETRGKTPALSLFSWDSLILTGAAFFLFWLGRQFETLNRRAVIPGTLFALICLLHFPVGTLLGVLLLYALHGKEGKIVFSKAYQPIAASRPPSPAQGPFRISVLGIFLVWLFGFFAVAGFFWLAAEIKW